MEMNDPNCVHCGDRVPEEEWRHWADRQIAHEGLCCDCFDLSCGMPLEQINVERAAKGKLPILAFRKLH